MSSKQLQQFYSIFPNGTIYKAALDSIVHSDQIKNIKIHSAIWKFYLLIFPNFNSISITQSKWMCLIDSKREEFNKIRELYSFSPNSELELDLMGPLSKNEDSKWNQYHKDNELRSMIARDTDRLFQDINFFHNKKNIENINEIIFLHLKKFPSLEYHQGFHEICGIVYYFLCKEMKVLKETQYSDEIKDLSGFNLIFSNDYISADSFWIYSEIINYIQKYYEDSKDTTFISNTCYNILQIYMKKIDWTLSQNLTDSNLEVMMYQWFRILFGRIFKFEQINQIWSFIFSYFPDDSLLSSISISLILSMKKEIINSSDKTAVIVIFKNMHSENARKIIKNSIQLRQPKQDKIKNDDQNKDLWKKYQENQKKSIQIRKELFDPICKETDKILLEINTEQKEIVIEHLKQLRDAFSVITLLTCQPSQHEKDIFSEEIAADLNADEDTVKNTESLNGNNNVQTNNKVVDNNNTIKELPKATSGKMNAIKADTSLLTEENEEVFRNKKDIFSIPNNPKNLFD